MSDKWEVVVGKKREKNPKQQKTQNSNTEEKKKVLEPVKKQQIVKGHVAAAPDFTNIDLDDDRKGSNKENQNKKNNPKKQQKNGSEANKSPEIKKVKQPKTLEQCLNSINVNELMETYELNVGGTNVSRLLDVARLFNSKLSVDQYDDTYSSESPDFPLSAVPSRVRQTFDNFLDVVYENNIQVFLELCLSSIANHMIKGSPASGYKIIIQLIGEKHPGLFPKCVNKVNSLMSSYQNRPPIGCSLLWAIGQGGLHDVKVGLEVWKQVMLPRIDLRHYVRNVAMYLINILKAHANNKEDRNRLTNDEVMELIDFLNTKRKATPKELEGQLSIQTSALRKLYFEKADTWSEPDVLEKLLERLPNVYVGRKLLNDITTKEIVFCFVEGLRKKDSNYKLWRDLQRNYLTQTTYILVFLEKHWSTIYPTLNKKQIINTLNHFKGVYSELHKKHPDDDAHRVSHQICQKLTKKVTKSRSLFWVFGSILLLPIIASLLIVYDVQRNGSFEKSNTGQFLESIGVLEQTQYAWYKGLSYSAKGYIWLETNTPYYYGATIDFAKPYWELSKDMALIVSGQVVQLYGNVRDYIVEKWPAVYNTIDEYIPGFLSTVQEYCAKAWSVTRDYTVSFYETTSTYLKTRVFIDNWAPSVLQEKTLQALNSTQQYAAQYYSWFHQQVDHYSKQ